MKRSTTLFVLLLAAFTSIAQYADWPHSGTLYILTTPEGADLAEGVHIQDFPLLVRLGKDWFDFSEAQADGRDVRFAGADSEPLAYEIEEWDAEVGTASIWLRIPQIRGNSSQAIRMFWGRADAASESNGTAVFNDSNGYVTVWHLNGDPTDAAGKLKAEDTGTSLTPGIIGKARHFPGGKGLNCGESLTVLPQGSTPSTSEVWVRAIRPNGRVIAWGNEKAQGKVTMYFSSPPHVRMDCYFSDANAKGSSRLPMEEWVHLVHTYSKGEARVYVNGQLDGENKRGTPLNVESPARLYIGGWYRRYNYVGDLDEVRVSQVKRSADWIKLQYENQKALGTVVGHIVQGGDSFASSHKAITIKEGNSLTVTATAGGARKLYWSIKAGDATRIVAVDRLSYELEAGRVIGDQSRVLQLKAVFAEGSKTIDIPVTVLEAIPEPAFTLNTAEKWDGRQTIELRPEISNLAAMEAAGASTLDYDWQVSGLATIHRTEPGKLILERAQNSGIATITATIGNGGTPVSASTTIEIREPNYDAWVVRTPQQDEKPQDKQFYARDDRNQGTAHCNGILTEPADSLLLKLYADDTLSQTLTQQPGPDLGYAFAVKLKPGLIRYKIELFAKTGNKETLIHRASDLLCGDAYIIEGQSNALATDTRDQSPDEPHEWVRSYAYPQNSQEPEQNLWCNPVWKFAGGKARAESQRKHKAVLGWWGMDLAKRLVRQHRMPICIFNGAVGGTRIDQHQRDEANPTNPDTIYGRLLWRLQQAKLTHGIRAVIWHQGENDQGAAGPDGGYGWETYQRYFVAMSGAWKRDYPNIRHYYVFQIWPNACAMGQGNGDMLRERQRTLPFLYSNMDVLSTYGITPPGGCHYPLEGWSKFTDMLLPLINRDLYARDPVRFITSPNLLQAAYTSAAQDAIALQFDQAVTWDEKLTSQFHLDGQTDQVASGSSVGGLLTLKLKAPSTASSISYLKEKSNWRQGPFLHGANDMAALSFCKVPIAAPTPTIDAPFSYRTDTMASRPIPRPYSHMWSLWMKHHNGLADGLAKQEKVDLLMVGDSITFRFARAGRKVFEQYYKPRNGYNFGSSGDRTEHILWRLRNGKLDSIRPKLVTLLIGTNNLMRKEETPEQTAYAIDAITKELRQRLPEAKILILGIFPRGRTVDDPGRLRNEKVNSLISKLQDSEKIFYLDVGHVFLNPDRTINTDLISDTVHPNEKGFEAWAEAMEPTIKRLLGEN